MSGGVGGGGGGGEPDGVAFVASRTADIISNGVAVETELWRTSVPAGTLAAGKKLRVTVLGVLATGAARSCELTCYFGDPDVDADSVGVEPPDVSGNRQFLATFEVTAKSAPAEALDLLGSMKIDQGGGSQLSDVLFAQASGSKDVSQALDLSIWWSPQDSADTLTIRNAFVEVVG